VSVVFTLDNARPRPSSSLTVVDERLR